MQARLLPSALLDHFDGGADAGATEKAAGDKVVAPFFGSGRARFDGPGEGALGGGIHSSAASTSISTGRDRAAAHAPGAFAVPVGHRAEDQFCALSRQQAVLCESVVREGLKSTAG